jgi:hypothetical protein
MNIGRWLLGNSEQSDQVPTEDRFLFGVTQEWRIEDQIQSVRPTIGYVRPTR